MDDGLDVVTALRASAPGQILLCSACACYDLLPAHAANCQRVVAAVRECISAHHEGPLSDSLSEWVAARSVSHGNGEHEPAAPLPLLSPVTSDQQLDERQPHTHHARHGGEVSSTNM